ncbi:hypothetical protein TNCV_700731 [Trichonephila clavipes]|nr:hypothetical protein TNCV_700731 [Trichonephila clavipes]
MHLGDRFRFARFDDFKAVELPYNGENISMLILLPNQRDGLRNLEESLTPEKLSDIQKRMYETDVLISLPKFNNRFKKEQQFKHLVPILSSEQRPDHRDENCSLVDAPRFWPGGWFGVCREKLLGAVDMRRYPRAKTGSGETMKTTSREDRRIVRQALVDPTVTRSTIRTDVGVAIVPQTIYRHLAEANLKSKRPFRALPLTQ